MRAAHEERSTSPRWSIACWTVLPNGWGRWWDDATFLYARGHSLHLLDIASGKSRRWLAPGTVATTPGALADGRTFAVRFERYEGTRIVEHGMFFTGEHAAAVPGGSFPLPRVSPPRFDFHAMPTDSAAKAP